MKVVEKIKEILSKDKRKQLVFYFDENFEDNAFREHFQEIESNGIEVAEVNQNYFELKYKLEMEWQGEAVFIYHPFARPNNKELRKYALLDLLLANSELKLDDVSEFMAEYGLAQTDENLKLVKRYIKLLRLPTYKKRLARILDKGQFDEQSLKRGLISTTLGFSSVMDKNLCLAKSFEVALDKAAFEKTVVRMKELDLEGVLLLWFNTLFDTNFTDLTHTSMMEWASRLKYNLIMAPKKRTANLDSYARLKMVRTADINSLNNLYEDWRENKHLSAAIEPVFEELGAEVRTDNILKWYADDYVFGYYTPLMLTTIINVLYKSALKNAFRTKGDTGMWLKQDLLSETQKQEVLFIYHATSAMAVLDHYSSFMFNKPEDFIQKYKDDLYKVDTNFRKAVIAYEKARHKVYNMEEDAVTLFEELNKRYDRFLIDLNVEWLKVLNENNFDFHQIAVDKQFDFYKKHLSDFDYKMVVIVSDALRYELGQELYKDLLEEGKFMVEISPSLASVPSYTNLGMANLLPNEGMTVETTDTDLSFRINGKTTVSTNRAAILQSVVPEGATISFLQAMSFDSKAGREFFRDNRIVYIYHDWIDAIGDNRGTEHETFEATVKAVEDIKNLIGKLSTWNVRYARVTSDHGFLYNHNEIKANSRMNYPKTDGFCREHVRFVVADKFEGKVDGYQMDLRNTTNLDTDLKVVVPNAINRYHKQGNVGLQFVHGGASLQELLTPVIEIYRADKDTSETVTFTLVDKTDKITSGNMKVKLLQDQPVSNELKNNELVFAIYSEKGELLSNEVEVNLNSASGTPKERLQEFVLILNAQGSRSTIGWLRAYKKTNKMRINTDGVNDVVIISSLMEKDEF